jgi:rhamnosyltransferase
MDDRDRYSRDQGYRQFLHFFSDNNACLRRSVWERIPYPDVDFAEDQIWAKTIIEAGYAKAYAPAAAVYHSHSYNVIETARRAYDEAAAFQRLFGYNLGPSASHAVRQTINCTLHDVGWSLRQPRWWRLTGWMARAPFANVARQGGYYLGGRHARIPGWLRAWMSRDGRLKNQRA